MPLRIGRFSTYFKQCANDGDEFASLVAGRQREREARIGQRRIIRSECDDTFRDLLQGGLPVHALDPCEGETQDDVPALRERDAIGRTSGPIAGRRIARRLREPHQLPFDVQHPAELFREELAKPG
jgi:hypothetical protein